VGEAEHGVVQAASADGKNGSKPVANGICAAAALDQFATLLGKPVDQN
jgi:hypothetical protein